MSILGNYKKVLKEIQLADEMLSSGISEDMQIAIESRDKALDDKTAIEDFIESAVEFYMEHFEEFEVLNA